MSDYQILQGDCIQTMRTLPAQSVQCCVTSPPYFGLRDYGHEGQIGLEETPSAYVDKLVEVFREVRRLLRDDGVCWLNLGDSYSGSWGNYGGQNRGNGTQRDIHNGSQIDNKAYVNLSHWKPPTANVPGLKPKDLIGIPWRVAFALQDDGWWLRSEVIWHKKSPMPESVTDRPTKAHEQVFLLTKSATYFYDADAIAEQATQPVGVPVLTGQHKRGALQDLSASNLGTNQGASTRNKRSVWTLGPESYSGAHFATMPTKLVEPCILAGSKAGDTVLDPFSGSATVGAVALKHGRRYIGCELNPAYIELSHERIRRSQPLLLQVTA